MMCLNTDSPEYKRLIENTDTHPFEVFVKVNAWFKNNPDAVGYPTLKDLGLKSKTPITTSKNLFNETLSLLNEDGYIESYTDNIVTYKGVNFSIEQFFISNYGATMNSKGNVNIDAKQYFANRPGKFRQIKNALNISNDSVIFSLFNNYVNNANNPINKAGDTNGFIEYASMQQEPIQIQQNVNQQQNVNLSEKNIFTVEPIQSSDKKAKSKAKIATQYIGFAEGIEGSSTESYRQQILNQDKNNIFNPRDLKVGSKYKLNNGNTAIFIGYRYAETDSYQKSKVEIAVFEVNGKNVFRAVNAGKNYNIDVWNKGNISITNADRNLYNLTVQYSDLSLNFDSNIKQSDIVNSGNYSSNDVIFVSIPGKRGDETVRKQQQDKTIREAIKALEAGATLITDNAAYIESSSYNEGEKRLAANLKAKGYNYSEVVIDNNVLGVWSKSKVNKPTEPVRLNKPLTSEKINILQSKINRVLFNKLVESGKYQVQDMTVDYENTRKLEYADFEKLMSNKGELEASRNGYIVNLYDEFSELFIEYIQEAADLDYDYYIDDIKSFFESYYNPELLENEVKAFEKRIDALAKLVPEIANFKGSTTLGQLELFDTNEQTQQQLNLDAEKLFESNPQLANQVYQALGFVGDLNKLGVQDIKTYVGDKLTTVEDTAKSLISMILDGTYDEFTDAELTSFEKSVYIYSIERMSKNMYFNRYVAEVMEPYDDGYVEDNFSDDLKKKYNIRARTDFDVYEEFLNYKKEFSIDPNEVVRIFNIGNSAISDKIALKLYMALLSEDAGYSGLPDNLVELELQKVTPEQKQQAKQLYGSYLRNTNNPNINGFKNWLNNRNNDSLFGLDTKNQGQLEFHINTLNVISKFLENIGVEERLVPEFLSQDGSVIEGAIAAANFVEGTVDIIDDLNKGRAQAWNKLPEEAAHWWYRLLKENSPLKKALWESHKVALKNDQLYAGKYGKLVKSPADLTEESIGQLIAEAIKRIEAKKGNPSDYSFFKKFLEWINSIVAVFKNTKVDPFEVAAMKILSSDTSDLMTLEEYRKLNNIVNFADVLTEQSVAPVDYTLLEDIDQINYSVIYDEDTNSEVQVFYFANSPYFSTKEELDNWVTKRYGNLLIARQKQKIVEVRDNQIFFDRLLNKTFRKKSKFLPKTLRKYYDIIDNQNPKLLTEWDISKDLINITKKLSDQEKQQLIQTNGYTNIAPTLKVLPNLLQKYKKTPIVLSQPIKVDGAKKQELSILNGIREMIQLENPNLKSITAEEFVNEAHNWLQVNYMLGFANETGINGNISEGYPGYNIPNTFIHYNKNPNVSETDLEEYRNLTEEQIRNLTPERRQMFLDIAGLGNRQYDIYHNKISITFNDAQHLKYHPKSQLRHFKKFNNELIPSAWGNLTYFYSGKNKWKDAVLLHEIQNDNIEALREFKVTEIDLDTSLGRYLQGLNEDLINNIEIIESNNIRVNKRSDWEVNRITKQTHKLLNNQLQEIKDLPLEQGLQQLKEKLNEEIELYNSDSSKHLDKATENLDKAYSKKRIFQNLQTRGGIKSLLTKEDLSDLESILKRLNIKESAEDFGGWYEETAFEPIVYEINLSERKEQFNNLTHRFNEKINKKLKEIYGKDAPVITLDAPGKPRTRAQIRQGATRSQELNENVNFLISYSEKRVTKQLHANIEDSKQSLLFARNATASNNFNVSLSKITLEQYATLIENYKYNEDLLKRLIDEQIQKDTNKEIKEQNLLEELKSEVYEGSYEGEWVLSLDQKAYDYLPEGLRKTFRSNISKEALLKDFETYYNNWKAENNITSDKEIRLFKQKENFETLKQKALDKKAELEESYGKLEERVKQTLEIEMNYFTPLVHHLIQKHINQYGKDFPMYFSGYQITKLTQNNNRTALIYAGKDEIDIVNKQDFEFNGKRYRRRIGGFDYLVQQQGAQSGITQQEYEKAYQQATERRAKEIKVQAAQQLGLFPTASVEKLSDEKLQEGINALNEFKKIPKNDPRSKYNYKSNADVVIQTIMLLNNNKPIETGAIYNAMSQVSGVKLIWQDKIDGLQGDAGGYLVDLSNYNYNVPVLYGLSDDVPFQKIPSQQVKPGVKELFESNPELANAVYETAGFNKQDLSDTFINNLKLSGYNKYRKLTTYNLENEAQRQGVDLGKPIAGRPIASKLFSNIQDAFKYVLNSSLPNRLDKSSLLELRKDYLKKPLNEEDKQFALNAIDYLIEVMPQITLQQKQQALQLYSQYLDTIFPDSKVKDIVYHGSPNKEIQSFLSPEKEGYQKQETTTTGVAGIYFSDKKEVADLYQDFKKQGIKGKTYPVLLNIKKPIKVGEKATDGIIDGFSASMLWHIQKGVLQGLRKSGVDALMTGEYASKTSAVGENTEIAVFEPDQIHILGSKQDIEGFKQFVNQPTKKSKTIDPSQLKQIEHQILAYLAENPDATYDGALEALVRSGDLNLDCSM